MSDAQRKTGTLYVVATPIGNLADISARAIQVLRDCGLIAAEDTRHSAHLLQHLGIATPTVALHDFSTRRQLDRLLQQLAAGTDVALISDAGTPTIADPGYELVAAARAGAIAVVPVPGASALLAALSVAGLPTDRFLFEGFLPARQAARRASLQLLAAEPRTMIFYEAPHRIVACLHDMLDIFGAARSLYLGRELTKKFETSLLAPLAECIRHVESDPMQQKGEFVLVLAGCPGSELEQLRLRDGERMLADLLADMSVKKAVDVAARWSGAPRNALYALALARQRND